jgi:hypothetical protein
LQETRYFLKDWNLYEDVKVFPNPHSEDEQILHENIGIDEGGVSIIGLAKALPTGLKRGRAPPKKDSKKPSSSKDKKPATRKTPNQPSEKAKKKPNINSNTDKEQQSQRRSMRQVCTPIHTK